MFVETIANPVTQVADLQAIGDLCEKHNLIYFVDNTMTSPWLFKPVQVKASLVINALTKYIGGHGNALGGSVTDTGLYDWSGFDNIYDNYKGSDPAQWGITQIRKKGLRDFGAALAPEAAHHISVGSDTLSLEDGQGLRQCPGHCRILRSPSQGAQGVLPGTGQSSAA